MIPSNARATSPGDEAIALATRYLRPVLSGGSNLSIPIRAATFWLLLGAIAFCGIPASLARRSPQPTTLESWHKGPVRYLMNRTETRTFRRLKDDDARMAFVHRFWDRRDPDPRTPENEARLLFWSRVAEANRRFSDAVLPGWKTDRGKIFILLGPPNDIDERGNYNTGQINATRGLLRWHYDGLARAATRAKTIVAFTQQGDGDWHLTADPKLSSIYLNINEGVDDGYFATARASLQSFADVAPWGGSTLGTAMDLGRLQEVPTERELLKAVVSSEQFLGNYSGTFRASQLARPGASSSILVLTLALRKAELHPSFDGSAAGMSQRFVVSATLRPTGGQNSLGQIDIPEEAFVAEPSPDPADPWLRFQALRPVPPGRWALSGVIVDRMGGGAATQYGTVDVPQSDPRLPLLTGPVLATAIHEAGGAPGAGTHPFRTESHIIVPRMDSKLGSADRFALFLEVFPAHDDPGVVSLDWFFERSAREDGPFEQQGGKGHLDDARGTRAWDFPPGKLAPGWYRITFTARAPSGGESRRTIAFSVR